MITRWLIWSFEHNAWWASNEMGYVRNLVQAGRYSLERATEICEKANIAVRGDLPKEAMCPDWLEGVIS